MVSCWPDELKTFSQLEQPLQTADYSALTQLFSLFFLIIVQICFTFQNADNYMLLGHISSLQATMIHSVCFLFFLISLIFLNVLQNKTQVLVLLNAPLQQPRK